MGGRRLPQLPPFCTATWQPQAAMPLYKNSLRTAAGGEEP